MSYVETVLEAGIPDDVPSQLVVDFDIYNPPGGAEDFHLAWKRLQDSTDAAFVWSTRNGGHWIPLRGRFIHAIFADFTNFSSQLLFVPRERSEVYFGMPNTLNPPDHQPFRMLLAPTFSARNIRSLEPAIRAKAKSLIEGFVPSGGCEFITAYASELPIQLFMMLCDLPLADAPMLKYWSDQLPRPDGSMSIVEMLQKFDEYLSPYLDERLLNPGNDLISQLVRGDVRGRPVTRAEAINLCTQALLGGLDTVAALLGFAILFLARNPESRRELVKNPALIPGAVHELIRRYAIGIPARVVRKDHDYAGVHFRAGQMVILPTMLHGLDSEEFDKPLEVNFERPSGATSTFGNGVHLCPGQLLGRTELAVTLEEWLRLIPEFEVDPNTKITMTSGIVGVIDRLPLIWSVAGNRSNRG